MQGAMCSMSSNIFQASPGGSGTSNELSNSMDLSAVAHHFACAEPLPYPSRAGKEPPVIMSLPDELDADGQSVRAAMGRHGQSGNVQDGPDRLKPGITGVTKPARRL